MKIKWTYKLYHRGNQCNILITNSFIMVSICRAYCIEYKRKTIFLCSWIRHQWANIQSFVKLIRSSRNGTNQLRAQLTLDFCDSWVAKLVGILPRSNCNDLCQWRCIISRGLNANTSNSSFWWWFLKHATFVNRTHSERILVCTRIDNVDTETLIDTNGK